MAAGEKSIVGFKSAVFGTPTADGTFPVTTSPLLLVVPDSVSMVMEETTKTDLFVEGQDDPYISIPDTKRVKSVSFSIRDISPDTLKEWFGGTVTDEGAVGFNNVWESAIQESAINKALKLISKDFGGFHYEVTIYNASIRASLDGKFAKNETAVINIKADVQANYDAAGNAIPSTKIKKVATA